jgi:hypothetical protein
LTRKASNTSRKFKLHTTVSSCQCGIGARIPALTIVLANRRRVITIATISISTRQPPAPEPSAVMLPRSVLTVVPAFPVTPVAPKLVADPETEYQGRNSDMNTPTVASSAMRSPLPRRPKSIEVRGRYDPD